MDHEEANRLQASSRYLIGGLSAAETEAFEDHYFSCPECAEEVTSGAVFAENARAVFGAQSGPRLVPEPARTAVPGWFDRFRAAFAIPLAAAACLLLGVVAYQNSVVIPGLKTELASLGAPQGLTWVPLKLAREESAVTLPASSPFWMAYFRPPNTPAFPAYTCDIENGGGAKLRSVTLPAPAPGQPLSLLLRRSDFPTGTYRFSVQGQNSSTVLATYTIDLNTN